MLVHPLLHRQSGSAGLRDKALRSPCVPYQPGYLSYQQMNYSSGTARCENVTKCHKNTWVHDPYRVHLEGRFQHLSGQVLPLPAVSQANKLYLESKMFQLCPESPVFLPFSSSRSPGQPQPVVRGSPSPGVLCRGRAPSVTSVPALAAVLCGSV